MAPHRVFVSTDDPPRPRPHQVAAQTADLPDLAAVDAWAVRDADQSVARCPAPCPESDRDFHLLALADVEEPEDVVKALLHPLQGELQSAVNQPEPDGPRVVPPAEVWRQWVARESRSVADSVLAPRV